MCQRLMCFSISACSCVILTISSRLFRFLLHWLLHSCCTVGNRRFWYGFHVRMCNLLFNDFNMCMCNPKVSQLFVPFLMRSVEFR